jgi:hypothetical protein
MTTSSSLQSTAFNLLASPFTAVKSVLENGTAKTGTAAPKPHKKKQRARDVKAARFRSKSPKSDDAAKPHQQPSAASGGVPSPSAVYLYQSLPPPTLLAQPRSILVILDLNGTLLHRPTRRRPTKFVERPHAQEFLKYCLDTFYLAIWSSARPENVNYMAERLLTPAQREKCVVIWARDRFGLSQDDYDSKVQVYKRLSKIWNDPAVRASHPDAQHGGAWDQSNTVLVDDSREKGRSEPYNILPIPEFSGLEGAVPHVLPQVHDYLNTLCLQTDVSRYMRQHPFALDANYALRHS